VSFVNACDFINRIIFSFVVPTLENKANLRGTKNEHIS